MSKDFFQARGSLKARWLAVNKRALEFRRRAAAAEKEAAALQRALDTLEGVAEGMMDGESASQGRQTDRQNTMVVRIIEELKTRGPTSAPDLAKALGISYWSTHAYLKRGPFKVTGTVVSGRRHVQVWAADGDTETAAVDVAGDPTERE